MTDFAPTRSRPQRWDEPLGEEMTDALVERLLRIAPFDQMREGDFPRSVPLRGILRNDTRVVRFEPGELVVREGEYGESAFMLLDGSLRVALDHLPPDQLGRDTSRPTTGSRLRRALAQIWGQSEVPEIRHGRPPGEASKPRGLFLQDVPSVLDATRTATLSPGELFGELSALTRSPRTATIFAEHDATLLEIRWQGLRDLMQFSPALKEHVDRLYRQNSLRVHLRETELLAPLPDDALAKVSDAIQFETFGTFDWRDATPDPNALSLFERVQREPLVVEEGQPADALYLIRSGFARLTVGHGEGHQTLAYLGRGQAFGAEALVGGASQSEPSRWECSLRAVGYLDVLRLPRDLFLEHVLPHLPDSMRAEWQAKASPSTPSVGEVDARRLDFLVDHRLINATEAMVIDLERCTRCDDCVRACAATHDGNPRFVREGVVHDGLQYTSACMHCVDPVCMIGCPTGAIHRETSSGAVRINESTCIGCSTCAESCPYNNIRMVEIRTPQGALPIDTETNQPLLQATKCDLCVDQWTGPACQQACPHDALVRIDLASPLPLTDWTSRPA